MNKLNTTIFYLLLFTLATTSLAFAKPNRLLENLNLDTKVVKQIQNYRQLNREKAQVINKEIHELYEKLDKEISQKAYKRQNALMLIEEITQKRKKLMLNQLDHHEKLATLLTPEQLEVLKKVRSDHGYPRRNIKKYRPERGFFNWIKSKFRKERKGRPHR